MRVSCCVMVLPPGDLPRDRDVADQREHHARDAEAGVLEEAGIFRGEDRLAQVRRDVVVVNDDAAFDRELANQLAVLAEHARDRVGRVVVERADFGQVVGIREQHAAQRAEEGRGDKQRRDAGVTCVANGDFHYVEYACALAPRSVAKSACRFSYYRHRG